MHSITCVYIYICDSRTIKSGYTNFNVDHVSGWGYALILLFYIILFYFIFFKRRIYIQSTKKVTSLQRVIKKSRRKITKRFKKKRTKMEEEKKIIRIKYWLSILYSCYFLIRLIRSPLYKDIVKFLYLV